MSGRKTSAGLAATAWIAATALWVLFTWPLAAHLGAAIPELGLKNPPAEAIRTMSPGDHLQLLYHFRVFADMVAGHTPWFHNLYEFNTGADAERWEPGPWFMPFSLLFAAGQAVGGMAFGWNLVSWLSVGVTLWAAFALARRYVDDPRLALLAAAAAVALPYRWYGLLGGSPAGLATMYIPALLLGIDRAVRDLDGRGGALAGAALTLAAWSDIHVFFFGALVAPAWGVFAFLARDPWRRPTAREAARLAAVLGLVGAGIVLGYLSVHVGLGRISETAGGSGRPTQEIINFSPRLTGLFSWQDRGLASHLYLGYAAAALAALALGTAALYNRLLPRPARRAALLLLALTLGVLGVILLAAGPHGPKSGLPWRLARAVVPPYALIRQTGKIYCLMPGLFTVGFALAFAVLVRAPRLLLAAGAGLAAWAIVDARLQTHALLNRLDRTQGAYAAVAADAAKLGQVPRALVLPLWSGDAHYTSVYQHHAASYRIRMVNGYRPFVAESYHETIFRPLEPMNMGYVTEAALRNLTDRGVRWVVLHEDMFPEQVSPFPVALTLRSLLNHPRLELLAHDGPVWSFAIRDELRTKPAVGTDWTYLFPARTVEAETLEGARPGRDPAAGGGAFALLEGTGAALRAGPFACPPAAGLRWLVRARGHGTLRLGRGGGEPRDTPLDTNAWVWIGFHLPPPQELVSAALTLEAAAGRVDVDLALLTAGPWPAPAPGNKLEIPAPCFFHAGTIDLDAGTVVFRAGRDRPDLVFYGPRLPVAPGNYEVEVDAEVSRRTAVAGEWIVACPEGREIARTTVRGGEPARLAFTVDSNAPLLMAFVYRGSADVAIRRVTLSRKP